MKTVISLFSGIILLIGMGEVGMAQANQTSVPGLRVEPDAVSTGKGFTGVADSGGNTTFWNPAGLGFEKNTQLGLSRFKWLPGLDDDLAYQYLTGKYYLEGIGTLGGHITYLDLGSQDFRDAEGNSTGNFSSYEFAAGVSLGRIAIPNKLSVGGGLRFVSSRLVPGGAEVGGNTTKAGNTLALDFGGMYLPGDYLLFGKYVSPTIGASITNFGGRVSYTDSGIKSALPTLLRVGSSHKMKLDPEAINTVSLSLEISKFLVSSDSTGAEPPLKSLFTSWKTYDYFDGRKNQSVPLSKQLMIGVGVEYWYNDLIALRSGWYRESVDNGGRRFLTLGGSLKYSYIQVNSSISFQKDSAINNIVRLGLLLNL